MGPVTASSTLQVRVRATTYEAQHILGFELVPLSPATALSAFTAGAHIDVHLPGGLLRSYSLLNDPQETHRYRIGVNRDAHSRGGSRHMHEQLRTGTLLTISTPRNLFAMDETSPFNLFIAGGIGITPMLSMINWVVQQQPGRELWLFYGVRQAAELVMQAHLEALAARHPNLHLHLCFSASQPASILALPERVHHHHGRIDLRLLRSVLPLKPYHFYLCGPTQLLASLVPAMESWGVADERIHFEAFGPASIPRKKAASVALDSDAAGPAPVVRFARSDKQAPWDADLGSLLDFAQAHGVAVDSGCRAGSCGSCQTTILSGEVRYLQAPDFRPEPGTCLLCVCTPKTDVTLEA